jgi:hypothetical protein
MHAGEVRLLHLRTLLQQQVLPDFCWSEVSTAPQEMMRRVTGLVQRHITATALVCTLDTAHVTLYVHAQDETGTYHYGLALKSEWFKP